MASDPMSDARLEEIRQKARLGIVSADTVVELLNEVERLRAELEAAGCEYCADPPPHAVAAYAKVLAERAASRPATSPETTKRWISIADRLPRVERVNYDTFSESEHVLVTAVQSDTPFCEVAQLTVPMVSPAYWSDHMGNGVSGVTHWMPLPQPRSKPFHSRAR